MSEWQPIDTAPKKGFFLVTMQHRGERWVAVAAAKSTRPIWPTIDGTMTHWQHIPGPSK